MNDGLILIQDKYETQIERGVSIGTPAYVIELSGGGIYADRKKHSAIPFYDVFTNDEIMRMSLGAHLVFTGADALERQDEIIGFIEYLNRVNPPYLIEIETRGINAINEDLYNLVDFWHIYPLMIRENADKKKRVNLNVMTRLMMFGTYHNFMYYFRMKELHEWQEVNRDFLNIIPRINSCLISESEDIKALASRELIRYMNYKSE